MNWALQPQTCPGLFYGTPAQDGLLLRIRVPGGRLGAAQIEALLALGQQYRLDHLQVTNRANLQLRAVIHAPANEILQALQRQGLAAANPETDHLRNVMASPTAGIDPQELLDARPWVQALDHWIQHCPKLTDLPAKFSIGLDGGGTVAIGTRSALTWEHRYNEIQLSAIYLPGTHARPAGSYWRLALGGDRQMFPTSVLIPPEHCVATVAALSQVYRDYVTQHPLPSSKKPRMKHLLQDWGVAAYLERVAPHLPHPWLFLTEELAPRPAHPYAHLGVHAQGQPGQFYIGMALPLGQITCEQLQGLAQAAQQWGRGELRLTPWQGILVPYVPEAQVPALLQALMEMGLSPTAGVDSALVACAGRPGCGSAATQTQVHARELAQVLKAQLSLETPVNIHLSGCPKTCAQPSQADITLLGVPSDSACTERYHLYLGAFADCPLYESIPAAELPAHVLHLLRLYQQHRLSPQESFGDFAQSFHDWASSMPLLSAPVSPTHA